MTTLHRARFAPLLLSAFQLFSISAFGQGNLTPPGAPAPTMQTLDQLGTKTDQVNTKLDQVNAKADAIDAKSEKRTPISYLPYTINTGGSYYLTASLSVTSGDGITINTDNVSVDLNGYTISSTEGSPAGTGILIPGLKTNVRIREGFIRGNVNNTGGPFAGSGFAYGVRSTFGLYNARVDNISVSGCLVDGINVGGAAVAVQNCTVRNVGGRGISAESVLNCSANNCGTDGIVGRTVMNSSGEAVIGFGVYAENAENCHGLIGNAGNSSSVGVFATNAINCYGSVNNPGKGVEAQSARGCYGISAFGTGLSATIADGCYGSSTSGIGLSAAKVATNSVGITQADSTGLTANTVSNSYGEAVGVPSVSGHAARGIQALTVANSYGVAHGNSGSGTGSYGIDATVVSFSYGQNTAAPGINAGIAIGSWGVGSPSIVAGYKNLPP